MVGGNGDGIGDDVDGIDVGSGCGVDGVDEGALGGGENNIRAIVGCACNGSAIGDRKRVIVAIDEFVNGRSHDGGTYSQGSAIQANIATSAVRNTNRDKTSLQPPFREVDDGPHGFIFFCGGQ